MARFLPLLAALAMLLPAGTALAQKFAYVDLQRALNEVEAGKSAKNKLKAKFEKAQKELDAEQSSLKKKKEELDKKRLAMDEATLRGKMEELDKEMVRVTNLYAKLQKELNDEERKATAEIFDRMAQVVAQIAQRDGYDFVLERNESGLVYAQPALDITNDLIRRFNDANKGGGAKK